MPGDLADDERRIGVLAGTVAECVEDNPAVAALEIIEYIRKNPAALSAVDAQLATGFADRDVEQSLHIVRAMRHQVATETVERVSSAPARYRSRRPSQSALYRCVQERVETWLAHCRDGHDDEWSVPPYVEREFRRYLDCGILARAYCDACGHDLPVAFSCQGRGVCSSCNARRMVATAAHLTDHVLPPLPVGQ